FKTRVRDLFRPGIQVKTSSVGKFKAFTESPAMSAQVSHRLCDLLKSRFSFVGDRSPKTQCISRPASRHIKKGKVRVNFKIARDCLFKSSRIIAGVIPH